MKRGDCLWNIAKALLGSGSRYTEIYNLNKDKIKNPNLIYAGQVLRIPGVMPMGKLSFWYSRMAQPTT